MMVSEAQDFFDNEIRGLYPDWEPTLTEVDTWVSALKRFTVDMVGFALRKFYETREGGYKKPKLYKITELCRVEQQKAGIDNIKTDSEPVLLFALKCVEHPIQRKVGAKQSFFASTPKKVPGDKTRIRLCAEDMVEKFNQLYGGLWEIIRHWDTKELPF